MVRWQPLVVLVAISLAFAGCGSTSDESDQYDQYGAAPAREAGTEDPYAGDLDDVDNIDDLNDLDDIDEPTLVDVPDVTAEDGADAVSTLEDLGLTVSFAEEDGRDPSGCEVEDQDVIGDADPESDVTLTLDCRQVDWEARTGVDWEAFNSSYSSGWDAGCDLAFSVSPDGSLYEDDREFTASDCQINNPGDASSADIPTDAPDDPVSDGEELGTTDGCESAFDDLPYGGYALYYGDDSYDSSSCP